MEDEETKRLNRNKEIMKLKLENAKLKEIIRIQAEIITRYKELTDVTGGKWCVCYGNEEIISGDGV